VLGADTANASDAAKSTEWCDRLLIDCLTNMCRQDTSPPPPTPPSSDKFQREGAPKSQDRTAPDRFLRHEFEQRQAVNLFMSSISVHLISIASDLVSSELGAL